MATLIKKFLTLAATVSLTFSVTAAENVDLDIMNKIRDEGFNHSQVMKFTKHLSDNIGQRLSGGPQVMEANNWAVDKFKEWGLTNVKLEGFEFGRGWTAEYALVQMTAPRSVQIQAFSVSWHPGTNGVVEGEVIRVKIKTEKDFKKYKGKLKGKIVLLSPSAKARALPEKMVETYDETAIGYMLNYRIPDTKKAEKKDYAKILQGRHDKRIFKQKMWQFLKDEGALAGVKSRKSLKGGVFGSNGYGFRLGLTPALPLVVLSGEGYNRMRRLMKGETPVKLRIDVKVKYHDEDSKDYNVLADIKGKGRRPEVVMAGAHIDSWHLGDGATDNAAGVAIVMEAMRILKAIGVKPKRTIRAALWGAEEQGLNGSRSYIQNHIADHPKVEGYDELAKTLTSEYERKLRDWAKPINLKRGHDKFSVYFNLDNGGGKIRGITTHGNLVAADIFEQWFEPFHDLNAKTVSTLSSGSTDHAAFQTVGLPGYQFMQDPLDYFTRLHHTQLDVYDYVDEVNLKQNAVIMAAFLYNAAMRDDRMPRRPMPLKVAK